MKASVSVIMPAYNAERYVGAAISSVINQAFRDWELLVVDDCSTDTTAEIAQRFAAEDSRVTVLQNEKNMGVTASRNRAIAQAESEWIAFLDSDDLWREDKLEKQMDLVQTNKDAILTYTASAFMDENGNPYGYVMEAQPKITYRELLCKNLLSCSSVMVRRDWILRYPMSGDGMHEDYASWLQMLRELPCAYGVNEPLLIYRLSKTSKSGSRVKSAKMIYRTYRFVGYNPLTALYFTFRYLPYSVSKRRKIYQSAIG